MYKLLIVDDEELDRKLVRLMLEGETQFEIVGEAEDGLAAIKLAQKLEPDIILMDIRMPDKNGLDAAKEIKASLGKVKIIMLTAYDDFHYAREAISGKASAYLLKPIDQEELLETLSRTARELEEENIEKQKQAQVKAEFDANIDVIRTRFFNDLLEGSWKDHGIYEDLEERLALLQLVVLPNVVVVFKLEEGLNRQEKAPYVFYELLRHEIFIHLKNTLKEYFRNSFLLSDSFRSNYILAAVPENNEIQKKELLQLLSDWQRKIQEAYSIPIAIGIGRTYERIFEIAKSYEEAMIAISSNMGEGSLICYDDLGEEGNMTSYPSYLEEQLLLAIRTGNLNESMKLVEHFLSYFIDKVDLKMGKLLVSETLLKAMRVVIVSGTAELKAIEDQLEITKQLVAMDNWVELSSWLRHKIQNLVELVVAAKGSRKYKLVQRSEEYLKEHYGRDLSLDEVSSDLQISSCYFSSIFKEVTGSSFSDYLLDLRIAKAKELLGNPLLTISEVGYKVGFNDPAYFSRVFKRIVGVSPTFFRDAQ